MGFMDRVRPIALHRLFVLKPAASSVFYPYRFPPHLLNFLSPVRKKLESSSQFPIYLTTCFKTVETSAQRISAFG